MKWLLILNCAFFILYYYAVRNDYGFLFGDLALRAQDVLNLKRPAIWQLFTYMFLHDPTGFAHILFNMLILWMCGSELERDWGTKRFLQYYFLCGVGAGLCVVVADALHGKPGAFTIGSSGAIYGLLVAFGVLYADRIVLFAFLFPMKAKYLVMIFGVIAFMSSFGASGGGISHVAHLGGMVIGFIYLKRRHLSFNLLAPLGRQYQSWKLRRAKKRFQVYIRRRDSSKHGPWVN